MADPESGERVKVFRNRETGELAVRLPGSDQLTPVSEEDLAILQESGPGAFIRSADNAIQQAGTGARILGRRAFGEDPQDDVARLDELRRAQDLRSGESPVAGFAGSVAPDVSIGLMTGGTGSVARRIGATAAVEGALGASRTPEAPIQSGLIQAAIGAAAAGAGPAISATTRRVHPYVSRVTGSVQGVIERTRGAGGADDVAGVYRSRAGSQAMDTAADARRGAQAGVDDLAPVGAADDLGAPQRVSGGAAGADVTRRPDQTIGQMRHAGATTADEMVDRWQFPLSKNDAEMLDAVDDRSFEAAKANKLDEWQRSRTGTVLSDLIDGKRTDFSQLSIEQNRAVRRNLATEIGQPQAQRLTRQTVGDNLTRISEELQDLIKQSGPVRAEPVLDGWKDLEAQFGEGPAGIYLRRVIKQADEKVGAGRFLSPSEASDLRNRISSQMESMGKNEPDLEGVQVLGAAREYLDAELKRNWSPEMNEQFQELGYQWKLSQALIRGAKGAISDDGGISLPQFMNNWRMLDNMVRTGRRKENEFLNFMEAAAQVMSVRGPESGTPAGLAAGLRSMAEDRLTGALGPLGGVLR